MASLKLNNGPKTQGAFTNLKVDRITYKWIIKNFELLHHKPTKSIVSPLFHTGHSNESWRLKFYPRSDDKNSADSTSLFLDCHSSDRLSRGLIVKYNFKMLRANEIIDEVEDIATYNNKDTGWGYREFVSRAKLITNDDLDDTLTIVCTMKIGDSYVRTSTYVAPDQEEPSLRDMRENGLSDDFRSLLKEPKFSDVVLIVGDEKFQAHKSILSARSPVFAVMFDQHEMEENLKNEVKIENMDAAVVKGMLEFIYTNGVNDLQLLAAGLRGAAEKYDIKELKVVCDKTLCNMLNQDNAVEMLVLADLYHAKELRKHVMDYIIRNFSEVAKTEGYKEIKDPILLKEIICSFSMQCAGSSD